MYIKQTWTNGDLIIASKLNHIEEGIEENQLPEITTADIGKYLIGVLDTDNVQAGEVICPEQTVVFSDGEEIALTTKSFGSTTTNTKLADTTTLPSELLQIPYGILTVNGDDYLVQLHSDGYYTDTDIFPAYALFWNNNDQQFMFCANDEDWEILYGTYTLSFSAAEVGVKWGLSNQVSGIDVGPSNPIAV